MIFSDKLLNSSLEDIPFYEQEVNTFHSKNSIMLTLLGNKYYNLGNELKAKEYLTKALYLNKNCVPALYNLCIIYVLNGDPKVETLLDTYLKYHTLENKLKILITTRNRFPYFAYKHYKKIIVCQISDPRIRFHVYDTLIYLSAIQKTNVDLKLRLDFCKKQLSIKITDAAICGYFMARQYVETTSHPLYPITNENQRIDLNIHFETKEYIPHRKKNKRIRVGFVTPGFNKNAVSMFSYDIFNSLDIENFEVFVYYENDNYTRLLKSNKDVNWVSIKNSTNELVYKYIHDIHKIDILFDLMVFGSNRTRLFAMRPARVIINYLGYPGSSFMDCYTHRIVDKITDSEKYASKYNTEQLIYLPKTFICWKNLDPVVGIDFQTNEYPDKITIGIMNRTEKISSKCVSIWNKVSSKHNILFCVKSPVVIPYLKNAIYIKKYFPDRKDYYNIFNQFDYTIDTFPYSGTTTTAISLYMGCPVLSLYNETSLHVSNVSASFNIHSGLDEYVFKNVNSLLKFKFPKFRDNFRRKQIRKKFLKCMDSKGFIKEFENVLKTI